MPHLVETLIDCRAVFLNLFAVAEPSANVCVAHETLRNDPSVYPAFCNKPLKQWYCYKRIKLWLRISSQAISFRFGGTLRFHRTPVEKHWTRG